MTPKPEPPLEQCLPEGQLVDRAWLLARGFSRPIVDYALRVGKLDTVGPVLIWTTALIIDLIARKEKSEN